MSNRDLRTQSYGGDVALDCWVFRRGWEGQSPRGSWPWETQEEGEAAQQGQVVMLTAAR